MVMIGWPLFLSYFYSVENDLIEKQLRIKRILQKWGKHNLIFNIRVWSHRTEEKLVIELSLFFYSLFI